MFHKNSVCGISNAAQSNVSSDNVPNGEGSLDRSCAQPDVAVQFSNNLDHGYLRCARLSLASFLLVALESCSSPARTKASASLNSSRIAAANRGSTTPVVRVGSKAILPTAAPVGANFVAHVMPTNAIDLRRRESSHDAAIRPEKVGLVSHEVNGTFARIAADLHDELARDRIEISLSGTSGPMQTLHDILHKPGVDIGLVQADALESLLLAGSSADPKHHLRYIARIYDEEVHVIARAQVTSLRQLDGLRVNIDKSGSGSDITARLLFSRLGLKAKFTSFETTEALEKLRAGEIDAVFILAPRPSVDVLRFQDDRFHLVDVPLDLDVGRPYSGTEFQADDYPTLIKDGERVRTIAVGVVLAVYNWPKGSRGFGRLERFAKSLSQRLAQGPQPVRHFAWNTVNFDAEVYGWDRFQLGDVQQHRPKPQTSDGRASQGSPIGPTNKN
jgi:TRAP-type uncharacterized transport system substrate-binding protein